MRSSASTLTSGFIAPLKGIFVLWGALILNYFLGPTSFPFPSAISVFFFFAVAGAVAGGVAVGNGGSLRCHTLNFAGLGAALKSWKWPSLVCVVLSGVAMVIGLRIVMATGRTLDQALNDTGMVRHREYDEGGIRSALVNAVGFLSFSWVFISVMYLRFAGGVKGEFNVLRLVASAVGVGSILLLYVVIVSRNAFLVLILATCFYVAIAEFGSFKNAFRRLGAVGNLAGFIVALLVMGYMLFISVSRTAGDRENSQFVNTWMSFKYRLSPLESVNYEVAAGVYKLQWYAAHPLRNLDDIMASDPPFIRSGGASSVLNWPIQQVSRFIPEARSYIDSSTIQYYSLTAVLGDNAWQWASGLTAIISDFGVVGALVVLFVWGAIIGWTYRDFMQHGSFLSGIICIWICIFVSVIPLFFPIDNFLQTNLYAMLGLKAMFLITGQRHI
jgi:hypothetical protein